MEKRKILVIGAGGRIARHVIQFLRQDKRLKLTLFLRDVKKLKMSGDLTISTVEGDVFNAQQLNDAVKGQDIVYANLSGNIDEQAKEIAGVMNANGVKRLIFVTSLGIYDEVPGAFGKWNNTMIGEALKPYRKAADYIESSGLDYTIVRPAWLQDKDEVDYETTQKGEPFKGTEVSRKSVGALIADIIKHPEKESRASIGVNKPNTDGDKPAFY